MQLHSEVPLKQCSYYSDTRGVIATTLEPQNSHDPLPTTIRKPETFVGQRSTKVSPKPTEVSFFCRLFLVDKSQKVVTFVDHWPTEPTVVASVGRP
jgi:hypothetical protein